MGDFQSSREGLRIEDFQSFDEGFGFLDFLDWNEDFFQPLRVRQKMLLSRVRSANIVQGDSGAFCSSQLDSSLLVSKYVVKVQRKSYRQISRQQLLH